MLNGELVVNGQAVAFPHNILWWHEIVNIEFGARRFAVTNCPLTGSAIVFDAKAVPTRRGRVPWNGRPRCSWEVSTESQRCGRQAQRLERERRCCGIRRWLVGGRAGTRRCSVLPRGSSWCFHARHRALLNGVRRHVLRSMAPRVSGLDCRALRASLRRRQQQGRRQYRAPGKAVACSLVRALARLVSAGLPRRR